MQVVKNSKISFDGQLLEVVMEMSFLFFSNPREKLPWRDHSTEK